MRVVVAVAPVGRVVVVVAAVVVVAVVVVVVVVVVVGSTTVESRLPQQEIDPKFDHIIEVRVSFIKPLVEKNSPGHWKVLEAGSRPFVERQFRELIGEASLATSPARPLKTFRPRDTKVHGEIITGGKIEAVVPVKADCIATVLKLSGSKGVIVDAADREYNRENGIVMVHFPRATIQAECARRLREVPQHLGMVMSTNGWQARAPKDNVYAATTVINSPHLRFEFLSQPRPLTSMVCTYD